MTQLRRRGALEWGIVMAAPLWAALLPTATWLAGARASVAARFGAAGVYGLGSVICHQQPMRSFQLWGETMPVCARCTGIYAGAAFAALAVAVFRRPSLCSGLLERFFVRRHAGSASSARKLLFLSAAPAVVSLLYEWITGHVPSNPVRAGTGVVLGAGVLLVLIGGFAVDDPPQRMR